MDSPHSSGRMFGESRKKIFMKIKILEITEDGVDMFATTQKDRWFTQVLQDAFQEDYQASSNGTLNLHLLRSCDNIMISGTSTIRIRPECDRCLEIFNLNLQVPLKVNLSPRPPSESHKEEGHDDMGTVDSNNEHFSFYEGEEINLSETLREMFLLEVPFRYLCAETCKGLCPQCGENLNRATCQCAPIKSDPRLAVLKKLLEH